MTLLKSVTTPVKADFANDSLGHMVAIHCFVPVVSILFGTVESWEQPVEKEKLLFSYTAVLKAIESIQTGQFTDFDGHTTSNCCHGMALLAYHLIQSVGQLDLNEILLEGTKKIQALENSADSVQECTWIIPHALAQLSCLYILGLIKEIDPIKGGRTNTKKLKTLASISTNLCNQIVHSLQKRFSNWIANSYDLYRDELDGKMQISGAPVEMWGKYVQEDFIRTDRKGVQYASNLFSMQISLAHMIKSKAKVALINDILTSDGSLEGRYVCLFEGDGEENLRPLTHEEVKLLSLEDQNEPVVVFGGCSHADALNCDALHLQMQPWIYQLPKLILACDVFYPQFLNLATDPDFNSCPIKPEEKLLNEIIQTHLQVKGVSSADPSLYCATHIYPASLSQVLATQNSQDDSALPISYIPGIKLTAQA